jgi:hypothetical protein
VSGQPGHRILVAVACAALVLLIPPYYLLASSYKELETLKQEINSIMRLVTVTWNDGTTTVYSDCSNVDTSDNGTVTFTGKKGSSTTEGNYSIGHGTYREVEDLPQAEPL